MLLGAGLDTFAYPNLYNDLRVFEVDHPSTQKWKREPLGCNGIQIPGTLTFVPVDFERQRLADQLRTARFDFGAAAFLPGLGGPDLTLEAFRATIGLIAARPAGSSVVLDYGQPGKALPLTERLARDMLAAHVRKAGEPFRLFFTPDQIAGGFPTSGRSRTWDRQKSTRDTQQAARPAQPEGLVGTAAVRLAVDG